VRSPSSMRPIVAALAVAAFALPAFGPAVLPTVADAAQQGDIYPGSQYREEYIDAFDLSTSGAPQDTTTTLHADVLRSKDVAWSVQQPIVLVVSPYTNHNDGGAGLMDGNGPSPRFYDFLEVTGSLDRGYTFVQVDLPGFGGSGGCNDWGGPVEQRGVKLAVEWAAAQPWSTGKVALLGKSYDGWTGLMGMAQDPVGLAAVVSMEPVYSGYRYLHNDGVRFLNAAATPALFQVYDAQPGALNDEPAYHLSGTPQVYCWGPNYAQQQLDSEDIGFWAERDLVRLAEGSTVPLFLTQGFLETNTKPDAAFSYFNAMDNPDNRAWYGQFDHVRGWEQQGDRFAMGRSGFAAEVNRFLDQHLRGIEPSIDDPAIAVQDNLGRYRAEDAWPPADAIGRTTALASGSFTDGVGSSYSSDGVWSVSQVLDTPRWMAGEPVVSATVTTLAPRTNLVANVYDIAPDGTARLMSRGTTLVRDLGEQVVNVELYGQDWHVDAGHRIAVRIVGGNTDWWQHVPTRTSVQVLSADVTLPLLRDKRTSFIDGEATPRLENHNGRTLQMGNVSSTDVTFNLGPEMR
jgi:predicted acyl esterase